MRVFLHGRFSIDNKMRPLAVRRIIQMDRAGPGVDGAFRRDKATTLTASKPGGRTFFCVKGPWLKAGIDRRLGDGLLCAGQRAGHFEV